MTKFSGVFKQDNGHISADNTVFVLEREYGITNADDKRPVLMTTGILGYDTLGCIGILLYDPTSKVGSLTHLIDNGKFSQTIDKVIEHIMKYSGRRFLGRVVRPTENPVISNQIEQTQKKLQKNGILIEPFELVPEQTVVFDTRDGEFYQRCPELYLPSIEERPYGNRIIREGCLVRVNPSQMSCCYEPKRR